MRHVEEGRKTRRRRRGEGKKEEEREGKKEERKGRAGRTQYIVGGYLRRKRHEQQIDGRPPGPEWVLRGPPNERHNLSSSSSFFSSFFPRPRDFVPVAPHCPGKKCARPSAGLTTSTRVFGRSRFQPNDSFMRPLSSYTAARAAHAVFRGEKPLREEEERVKLFSKFTDRNF